MKPEFKAFVQQAVRFLRGIGFSLPKALATIFLLVIGAAAIMGGITYVVILVLVRATIEVFNTASGTSIAPWAPTAFAWIGGIGVFFLMTVGIVLMIDELRGWLSKFLLIGLAAGVLGGVYKAMLPVATDAGPLAVACLTSLLLCVGAYIVAHLLGHGESVKILSGWLPIGLAILLFITLLGFHACGKKSGGPEKKERVVQTVQLTLGGMPQGVFNNVSWPKSHRFVSTPSQVKAMRWKLEPDSACGTVWVNETIPVANQCGNSPEIPSLRKAGIIGPNANIHSLQFEGIGMKGMAYVE